VGDKCWHAYGPQSVYGTLLARAAAMGLPLITSTVATVDIIRLLHSELYMKRPSFTDRAWSDRWSDD